MYVARFIPWNSKRHINLITLVRNRAGSDPKTAQLFGGGGGVFVGFLSKSSLCSY